MCRGVTNQLGHEHAIQRYPQACSLYARQRTHKLFKQKNIPGVILSIKSIEQCDTLGHLCIDVTPWVLERPRNRDCKLWTFGDREGRKVEGKRNRLDV